MTKLQEILKRLNIMIYQSQMDENNLVPPVIKEISDEIDVLIDELEVIPKT